MSSGFGFSPFPQQPAPDPRQVGRMLRMAPAGLPGSPMGRPTPDQGAEPYSYVGATSIDESHHLRRLGAIRTGGAGQSGTGSAPPEDPDADTEGDDAMVNAAIGEALTRLGGGLMRNADISPERAERRKQDLLRLGISAFEAHVLSQSGGI
jgi:hypothetical protein